MQGESNSKAGKRSFTGLDTAEPRLILYKDNANERKESSLLISRVQLILYKDNANERKKSSLLLSRVQCILYTKIREKNDTINYQTSPIPFSLIKINSYCLHIIIK